jgi:hypothetical protein
MSKYYTPEIEEFYVGFEYEFHSMTTGGLEIVDFSKNPIVSKTISKPTYKIWSKEIIYRDDCALYNRSFKSLEGLIKSKQIRVKYLDREDIESLGWKFDKTSNEGQRKFFKDNMCLYYRPETHELGIFTIDPSKSDYMMKHVMDNKQVHIVIIKNKSELKKLMKQLNIS